MSKLEALTIRFVCKYFVSLPSENKQHFFRIFCMQFFVLLRIFRFLLFLFASNDSFRFRFASDFKYFAYMRTKRKNPLFFASKRKNFSLPFRFVSLRSENERRTLLPMYGYIFSSGISIKYIILTTSFSGI